MTEQSWAVFSKKKSCTVQLWQGCSPPHLPEASGHPPQLMSWLLHLFPIWCCGEISLYPVQLGSGFFVLPEQCKRIRVNCNICPSVLSVKCFTARNIECRNRERVSIINYLKIRKNLQQWVGKNYSSWLLACWVEQPEILHYRYQTWWPQQIQWIHALLSHWSHRDWWVQI